MKNKVYLLFILLNISGCAYNITRSYVIQNPTQVNVDCNPTIVKNINLFGIPSDFLGTIKLDESGMTMNCSEKQAIDILRQEACQLNANVINITAEQKPGMGSTCYRCIADFYQIESTDEYRGILSGLERVTFSYKDKDFVDWEDLSAIDQDEYSQPFRIYINFQVKSLGASFWDGSYKGFEVSPVFYSDISRIYEKEKNDQSLLQINLLFKLAYIYTNRLEYDLNQGRYTMNKQHEIQRIINEYLVKYYEEQSQLLRETSYGSNTKALNEMSESINQRLRDL